MKIGHLDECTVCGNPFKHRRICTGYADEEKTLKEVKLILSHATCRSLIERKKNLEQQLVDVEYAIYMKSI